jgi:hypothetical protein
LRQIRETHKKNVVKHIANVCALNFQWHAHLLARSALEGRKVGDSRGHHPLLRTVGDSRLHPRARAEINSGSDDHLEGVWWWCACVC